jgi:Zn-dependent protease
MIFLAPARLFTLLTAPQVVIDGIFLQATLTQTPALSLLLFLLFANATLFVFNLIPVLPLDGGRVLRAILAMWLPPWRATQLSLILGQLFAILLIITALALRSFGLLLLAIFVLLAGLPVLLNHRRLSRGGVEAGRNLGDR